VQVAKVDIDLPEWVKIDLFVLTVFFGVAIPVMAPMFVLAWLVLLDAALPSLEENIEAQAQQSLQPARFTFPEPRVGPLPGLETTQAWFFWQYIHHVSFGPETIDMALSVHSAFNPYEEPLGAILPDQWRVVGSPGPLILRLKLRDDLEKLGGPNLIVKWIVFDADTDKIVAAANKAYNDPQGNGILLDIHTPELYLIDNYDVRCAATLTLGSQVGDIWTGKKIIPVLDGIDRRHKYVKWASEVFFQNEGTGGNWWTQKRKSRIHRTAVSSRCLASRELGAERLSDLIQSSDKFPADWVEANRRRLEVLDVGLTYFDTLAFEWSELNRHRVPLCEYCFFGGPDKTVPFPEEDWFMRRTYEGIGH
jgi:hypothetical protein